MFSTESKEQKRTGKIWGMAMLTPVLKVTSSEAISEERGCDPFEITHKQWTIPHLCLHGDYFASSCHQVRVASSKPRPPTLTLLLPRNGGCKCLFNHVTQPLTGKFETFTSSVHV